MSPRWPIEAATADAAATGQAPTTGEAPVADEATVTSDDTPAPDEAAAVAEADPHDDAPAADERDAETDAESAHEAEGDQTPEPAEALPEPAAPSTVAELIAATLRAAGVRIAFTVPGESFLPVLDALQAAGIRIVATRHEGGAAFAAEAYGQLTGRPAACLGTRAVGAANLAIGIHTATADSTPMFVLVGQVDRSVRGTRGVPGGRPRQHHRKACEVGGRDR